MSIPAGPNRRAALALSLAAGLAGLTCLAWTRAAQAHEVGLSRGIYTVLGREVAAELTFARAELLGLVPALDVDEDGALTDSELSSGTGALQPVAAGFALVGDDRPCVGELIDAALTEEDGARLRMRFTCPLEPRRLTLGLPVLGQLKSGHRHLAQLARVDGEVFADLVLHRRAATASVELPVDAMAPRAPSTPSVRAYFEIGVEHILIGTDHLVFLLGLVVVGGRLRSLIAVVTAFTIGHSLSLALATLGVWRPDPAFVEPAIALSIAYVGVEAGQLLVLAVVLPLLAWLGARPAYQRARGPRWISAAIVVAGLFWFIQRVGFAQ